MPDDNIEALVLATQSRDGNTFRDLSDLVERRLWLRALGEPMPRLETLRELAEHKWPEQNRRAHRSNLGLPVSPFIGLLIFGIAYGITRFRLR